MTSTEKAKETRKRNKEARKERYQEGLQIRDAMKRACLSVLDDPSASSGDRIKATEILDTLMRGK